MKAKCKKCGNNLLKGKNGDYLCPKCASRYRRIAGDKYWLYIVLTIVIVNLLHNMFMSVFNLSQYGFPVYLLVLFILIIPILIIEIYFTPILIKFDVYELEKIN